MKRVVTALIACALLCSTYGAWAPIYNVDITPAVPTLSDTILITASGDTGSSSWFVDSSRVLLSGNQMVLDIFMKESGIAVPTVSPWNHMETIGPLNSGAYDLSVKTYQNSVLADTFQTDFAVIPEPSSVAMFSVGGVLLYHRRRRSLARQHAALLRRDR